MSGILGIIGAAGGLFSNYAANETNREIAQQTNAANRQINQSQIDYMREEADKADARTRALYNDLYSPKAKLQQLIEAGLSPGLIYGMGGAGGTSSTSGAQAGTATMLPAQGYSINPIMNAEIANLIANSQKIAAETRNIEANTENLNKDLSVKEQAIKLAEAQTEECKQRAKLAYENIYNALEERKNIAADTKNKEAQEEATRAQTKLTEINQRLLSNDLLYRDDMNYWQAQKIQEEFYQLIDQGKKLNIEANMWNDYMNATLKEMASRALLNAANATNSQQEKEWIAQQTKALKMSNDAEEYLNNLLQDEDDEDGQGGGIRKAAKNTLKFLLEAWRTTKQGGNKK